MFHFSSCFWVLSETVIVDLMSVHWRTPIPLIGWLQVGQISKFFTHTLRCNPSSLMHRQIRRRCICFNLSFVISPITSPLVVCLRLHRFRPTRNKVHTRTLGNVGDGAGSLPQPNQERIRSLHASHLQRWIHRLWKTTQPIPYRSVRSPAVRRLGEHHKYS